MRRALITGGAGFIGSHLCDQLLARDVAVRVLDDLSPQVHGPDVGRPSYLARDVELIVGDVREPRDVERALMHVDVVFHFAAKVGVGQSMYEVADYTSVNNLGTAVLLEALMRRPVEKLIVASSMSVYGEGLCQSRNGRPRSAPRRGAEQIEVGNFDLLDEDGEALNPLPTPEGKTVDLASVYALSKYDQEQLCLIFGRAYGIPTVALRFFNVYGPRQALSNPYTGVLAIFAARLLSGKRPRVFEDGEQRRDFVSVHDVAHACWRALASERADGQAINIGSGNSYSINEVARRLARALGLEHLTPEMTGTYRQGDIRHCFADIGRARALLDYRPEVSLEQGLEELVAWLRTQRAQERWDDAYAELKRRGLAQ